VCRGGPKLGVGEKKKLPPANFDLNRLRELAKDRPGWRKMLKSIKIRR
jgi:hypothetical protein